MSYRAQKMTGIAFLATSLFMSLVTVPALSGAEATGIHKLSVTPRCVTARENAKPISVTLVDVRPHTWWTFGLVSLNARGGSEGPNWGKHQANSEGQVHFKHAAPHMKSAAGGYNVSSLHMFGNKGVGYHVRLKVNAGACKTN